jgi:hypothetical protein
MLLNKENSNSDYLIIAKILSEHDLFSNLPEISKEYRSQSRPNRYCKLDIFFPVEFRFQTVNILNERHVFNAIAEYRKKYYTLYFNYDKNTALISKFYIYFYSSALAVLNIDNNYDMLKKLVSNPYMNYYEFTPFTEKMIG